MPKLTSSRLYTTEDTEVSQEDFERVLEALQPARWGIKGARPPRPRPVPRALQRLSSGGSGAPSRRPLPPHHESANTTQRVCARNASTVVNSPPAAIGTPTHTLSKAEASSVVVRQRPGPVVSTLRPSPWASPLACEGYARAAYDGETVEPKSDEVPSESTSLTDALSEPSLPPCEQLNDIDSGSSSSGYTRMESVHPTSSARPLARTNLFAGRGKFVPSSFSAGMRPNKQCRPTLAPFSVVKALSSLPASSAADEEVPPVADGAKMTHSVSAAVDERVASKPVDSSCHIPTPDVEVEVERSPETTFSSESTLPIANSPPLTANGASTVRGGRLRGVAAGRPLSMPESVDAEPTDVPLRRAPLYTTSAVRIVPQPPLAIGAAGATPGTQRPSLNRPASVVEPHVASPPESATPTSAPPSAAFSITHVASTDEFSTARSDNTTTTVGVPAPAPAPSALQLNREVSPISMLARKRLCRIPGQSSESSTASTPSVVSAVERSSAPPPAPAATTETPAPLSETAWLIATPVPSPPRQRGDAITAEPLQERPSVPASTALAKMAAVSPEAVRASVTSVKADHVSSPTTPPSCPAGGAYQRPTPALADAAVDAPPPPPPPPPPPRVLSAPPLPAETAVAPSLSGAAMVTAAAAPAAAATNKGDTKTVTPTLAPSTPSAKTALQGAHSIPVTTLTCAVRLGTEAPAPQSQSSRFMRLAATERFH